MDILIESYDKYPPFSSGGVTKTNWGAAYNTKNAIQCPKMSSRIHVLREDSMLRGEFRRVGVSSAVSKDQGPFQSDEGRTWYC